ncbi:MAG: cytochrome c-type biogenesis protein CcmH [Methylococcaceae bacterium]|nr:cytochrome c-type biogenesis protein CcmH [Methylococcaceae bacterium]
MKPLLIVFLLLLSPLASAVDTYQLTNPEQQAAYNTLVSELRCLVCQNQTIGDSNAELAADLRRQVYEMLQQGKSKDEILQFMTERYGDFVLYKPPFKAKTGLLWLGPVAFLVVGLLTVFLFVRRKKTIPSAKVEDVEKLAAVRRLLIDKDTENLS